MKSLFLSLAVLILSLSLFVSGCSKTSAGNEEGAVKIAFTALQQNDLAAFQAISITGSDFVLKAGNVNKYARKNSFIGGVQKKTEQDHAAMQFNLAREGWKGYIDFGDPAVECTGLGEVLWEGVVPHLNGVDIPAKVYSAKVKNQDGESENIPPYFQVVKWESVYRIMGLKFPHQNAEEAAAD